MVKTLCWEEKDNGKYCKNYNIKHKDKCYIHYESKTDIYLYLSKIIFMIIFSCVSYFVYIDNKQYFDSYFLEDLEMMLLTLKAYLFQLYKVDKNILTLYLYNLELLIMRYYSIISVYISKMIN
jgi:hypothetical protein